MFTRMFNIDLLWVHLSLVPILWGVFTPIAAYLTTNTLTQNDKVAVLASVLISAFPYPTYFGAISVPNSLGFIFFFFSLYFMMKYIESNDSKITILMLTFSFIAFLAHYLTGIISISLLLLAVAFKSSRNEKSLTATVRSSLLISLIVSASLLPLSLIYLRFFRPTTQTVFTLDKFYELPIEEIAGLFFLGELTYGFNLKTIVLVIIGPTLALLCMIYLIYSLKKNPDANNRILVHFLFASFLIMLVDYRVLKLFMSGLPLNEERLWVFRDFIAAPFVALAVYSIVSSIKTSLKTKSPSTMKIQNLKTFSKKDVLRVTSLLFALNVLIPILLGGWITVSLSAAYPQLAPLQTTWYELEAINYMEANTHEKYVVIGDIWTIFAGERIVGIMNPRAYYFGEYNQTGYSLFANMKREPSPEWMLTAMNYTDTKVAYFIVTEPRLGTEEFNNVVSRALQNKQLTVVGVFGAGKLYVFSYKKGQSV